jgi:CDP-glucose 4,6-dehydratase
MGVKMNSAFWKDKKVVITGFEGFLGANLTRELLKEGALVIGIDSKTNRKDTLFTKDDYKRITVIQADVADFELVKKIIFRNKIQVVFHLAAEAIVDRSFENPLNTFTSNIEGTWNILEASRQAGKNIEAVIIASSDKAYGSHEKLPYTESSSLKGSHPYDVSKSCADLISYTYAKSYNMPVAVTRCGNIYGPGDFNFSRIIPDTIRCALTGNCFLIRSDGKFLRDYVYVDDIVNAYLTLATKMNILDLQEKTFNFSNNHPYSVLEVVKMIYDLIGRKPDYKILNKSKHEIRNQYLSSQKALRILGWKPEFSLRQGLERTISWYRDYLNVKK